MCANLSGRDKWSACAVEWSVATPYREDLIALRVLSRLPFAFPIAGLMPDHALIDKQSILFMKLKIKRGKGHVRRMRKLKQLAGSAVDQTPFDLNVQKIRDLFGFGRDG
jgi:hypothetical protein